MTDELPWVRYGDERPRIHDIVEIEGEDGHRLMVGSEGWHGRLKSLGDELRYRIVDRWEPRHETSYGQEAEKCENCRFWDRLEMGKKPYPEVNGWCRRYAPQGPVIKSDDEGWQLFPPMNANQWCGDYSRKQVFPDAKAARAA